MVARPSTSTSRPISNSFVRWSSDRQRLDRLAFFPTFRDGAAAREVGWEVELAPLQTFDRSYPHVRAGMGESMNRREIPKADAFGRAHRALDFVDESCGTGRLEAQETDRFARYGRQRQLLADGAQAITARGDFHVVRVI